MTPKKQTQAESDADTFRSAPYTTRHDHHATLAHAHVVLAFIAMHFHQRGALAVASHLDDEISMAGPNYYRNVHC
jgi:hypothetical protein